MPHYAYHFLAFLQSLAVRLLLSVTYEAKPEHIKADGLLKLFMHTTDVVVNTRWLQSLLSFWNIPPHINLSSLEAVVADGFQQIQSASAESLKRVCVGGL